jgi:hypothetical protein
LAAGSLECQSSYPTEVHANFGALGDYIHNEPTVIKLSLEHDEVKFASKIGTGDPERFVEQSR